MNWGVFLLIAYINAQFPIKYSHLKVTNIENKQNVFADTLEWDIESGFINRMLDSIQMFKENNGVGPEITQDVFNLMLNLNEGNKTRFLNAYGIDLVKVDPIFPPRPSLPVASSIRGVFNETAWQPRMPTLIHLLLRSNVTKEEVFGVISPQRALKLTSILKETFPSDVLQRLGPMSRKKAAASKPRVPKIPAFILENIGILEIIFAILMMILFPDMFKEEKDEPEEEDDETEDSEGNPISRKDKAKRPKKPRTTPYPLCVIMRSLSYESPELITRNITLSKNNTEVLMDTLNDEEFKKFDYAKGKPKKLKDRILEIMKLEIKPDPQPPIDPKIGCRIRELLVKEFKKKDGHFRLEPGKKLPLAVRALMKATDKIPEKEAKRIKEILKERAVKGVSKHSDFKYRKLPAIMRLLATGDDGIATGERLPEVKGKYAVKIRRIFEKSLEAGNLDSKKHKLAFDNSAYGRALKKLLLRNRALKDMPVNTVYPQIDAKTALSVNRYLLDYHPNNPAKVESATPSSEPSVKSVLKYLSQFDQKEQKKTKKVTLNTENFINLARDVQMLI